MIVIGKGRLSAHGLLEELTGRSTGGAVRVRTPNADRLEALLRAAGKSPQRVEPGLLLVTDATSPEIGELSARENIVLHELVGEVVSLEDVFLQMTASAELAPRGREAS